MTDDFNIGLYKKYHDFFKNIPVKPIGTYPDGQKKYLKVEYNPNSNSFYFKNCYEIKDYLKSVGAKYVPESKSWMLNKTQFLLVTDRLFEYYDINTRIRAVRFGYTKYNEELKKFLGQDFYKDKRKNAILEGLNESISNLKRSGYYKVLRKYQIEAVEKIIYAYHNGSNGFILSDEQGLGKTLTAISFLHAVNCYGMNVLILTKKALVYNFYREILNYDFHFMSQYVVMDKVESGKICILSNTSLTSKKYDMMKSILWDIIVFDEVHTIKDIKGKRARNFIRMVEAQRKLNKNPFILALTGTLIKNRPLDAYNITRLLKMHDMSVLSFVKKFEGPHSRVFFRGYIPGFKYYKNISYEHVKEFKNFLESTGLYLSRKKEDVFYDMPEKNRIMRIIEFDSQINNELKEAIKNEKQIYETLKSEAKLSDEVLKMLPYYRRVISVYKVDYFIDYLEEFEELDRLIIFAHHNEVIEKIRDSIKNKYKDIDVRTLYGLDKNEDRKKNIEAFQSDNDEKIWLICSYSVASEGLTLTKANNMIFFELDWSVSVMLQAEDRIHRIGQNKICNYYYFIVPDTLDHYIYNVLNNKSQYLKGFSKESDIFSKIN